MWLTFLIKLFVAVILFDVIRDLTARLLDAKYGKEWRDSPLMLTWMRYRPYIGVALFVISTVIYASLGGK